MFLNWNTPYFGMIEEGIDPQIFAVLTLIKSKTKTKKFNSVQFRRFYMDATGNRSKASYLDFKERCLIFESIKVNKREIEIND